MLFAETAFVTFLGLVLGSFATALSYRLPQNISIVTKARSQCPSCRHALGAADLVPLFSWIFLKGKCRHCGARIGLRYPLIELATLFLCLLFFAIYGLRPETAAVFALAPVLVAIIDIDLWHRIIPDSLHVAVFLTGVAALGAGAALAAHPVSVLAARGMPALG
ncbi:MAG: A24 family peptidase, partial [Alphaproteobacteria bacterium]|nr:A24 family peptidase [Alphaproteobacteria bacterium]